MIIISDDNKIIMMKQSVGVCKSVTGTHVVGDLPASQFNHHHHHHHHHHHWHHYHHLCGHRCDAYDALVNDNDYVILEVLGPFVSQFQVQAYLIFVIPVVPMTNIRYGCTMYMCV